MSTQIFVNLPVANLERSREFFGALGYLFNPQLSDDHAACLIIDEDHIYVMLVEHDYYGVITGREIADTAIASETMITLTVDDRDEVEKVIQRAIDAGGARAKKPEDFGYLYRRGFYDTDGHHWEVMWMDPQEDPADQLIAVADEASAIADGERAVEDAEAITAEAAKVEESDTVSP
jgi:predicted lactoylglutathione lyase